MKKIDMYFRKYQGRWFWLACMVLALIALFLRIYNTPARYSLDGDSVRDAVVAIGGARAGQLPLTGPFSSTGPFTFGPWYYYQLILFSWLFHTPFAPWISMVIVSLAFIPVMFGIGKELHGKWFGLLLAAFATVSSTQVAIASSLSNINPIALFSSLAVWATIVIVKRRHTSLWWSFLLGTSLGLGINYHYQMAELLFLPLLIILFDMYKKKFSFRSIGIIILGIFLPCIPLLLFNLTNHWETVRGIVITAVYLKQSVYVANSWTIYLKSFWPDLGASALGIPRIFAVIVGLASIIVCGLLLYRKKLSAAHIILLITFLCNFLMLRYYWGERHVVYFSYFHPLIYIFCGEMFSFLFHRRYLAYLAGGSLMILLAVALWADLPLLQPSGQYPEYTQEAAALAKAYPGHRLLLYTCKGGINDVRARAATLLLSTTKQDAPSISIGFINGGGKCPFPDTIIVPRKEGDVRPWYEIAYPHVTGVKNIVEFSNASSGALVRANWKLLSVEGIYNEAARWWFTEQP